MATTCSERPLPPRCCGIEIPYTSVKSHMSPKEFESYTIELEKRTPNPIYCADQSCKTFIHPEDVNELEDLAKCQKCQKRTCTICLEPEHKKTECKRIDERGD
ncbi:hypothetical protein RUND412_009721, partial [Rhizina undulata]